MIVPPVLREMNYKKEFTLSFVLFHIIYSAVGGFSLYKATSIKTKTKTKIWGI